MPPRIPIRYSGDNLDFAEYAGKISVGSLAEIIQHAARLGDGKYMTKVVQSIAKICGVLPPLYGQ